LLLLWFLRFRFWLASGTQAPKYHFGFLDDESMVRGRLQAGGFADGTVHIGDHTAAATDDVVVVISDPRFVARRMAGWLDSPDESRLLQDVQVVVHGLRGERA
jgi:hypothetical protein